LKPELFPGLDPGMAVPTVRFPSVIVLAVVLLPLLPPAVGPAGAMPNGR